MSLLSASSEFIAGWQDRFNVWTKRKALKNVPLPEWHTLSVYRPNVLIEGTESDNEHTLVALDRDFYPTRYDWSHLPTRPADDKPFTLIIRDISKLQSGTDHQVLESWLSSPHRVQVVCTTSTPLFSLVKTGAFPERLYYRLNTVRVANLN